MFSLLDWVTSIDCYPAQSSAAYTRNSLSVNLPSDIPNNTNYGSKRLHKRATLTRETTQATLCMCLTTFQLFIYLFIYLFVYLFFSVPLALLSKRARENKANLANVKRPWVGAWSCHTVYAAPVTAYSNWWLWWVWGSTHFQVSGIEMLNGGLDTFCAKIATCIPRNISRIVLHSIVSCLPGTVSWYQPVRSELAFSKWCCLQKACVRWRCKRRQDRYQYSWPEIAWGHVEYSVQFSPVTDWVVGRGEGEEGRCSRVPLPVF